MKTRDEIVDAFNTAAAAGACLRVRNGYAVVVGPTILIPTPIIDEDAESPTYGQVISAATADVPSIVAVHGDGDDGYLFRQHAQDSEPDIYIEGDWETVLFEDEPEAPEATEPASPGASMLEGIG